MKALKINDELLKLENVNEETRGIQYNQRALIYLYSDRNDSAVHYLKKSLEHKIRKYYQATILSNYTKALLKQHKIKEAKKNI